MTAKEFLRNKKNEVGFRSQSSPLGSEGTEIEVMIEFAKLHVKAALEEASEKALLRFENYKGTWEEQAPYALDQYTDMKVSKDSILNAYPLENIK